MQVAKIVHWFHFFFFCTNGTVQYSYNIIELKRDFIKVSNITYLFSPRENILFYSFRKRIRLKWQKRCANRKEGGRDNDAEKKKIIRFSIKFLVKTVN